MLGHWAIWDIVYKYSGVCWVIVHGIARWEMVDFPWDSYGIYDMF